MLHCVHGYEDTTYESFAMHGHYKTPLFIRSKKDEYLDLAISDC